MRITIEDLEALKALNDEMEEHHGETEKAMQEDISQFSFHCLVSNCVINLAVLTDQRDTEIYEQSRKIQSLEESCQDLETTIVQFRELVLQLQT